MQMFVMSCLNGLSVFHHAEEKDLECVCESLNVPDRTAN